MKFAALLFIGAIASTTAMDVSDNQEKLYELMQLNTAECPKPLEISEDEMHYQLGEFSRNFQMESWNNAMHTKELYDKSFSFPKVRNYDYAVQNMNELEHYEDNLNANLSNALALERFINVAKKVRANLNDKYDIGFIDPGVEGDWQ